MLEAKCLTDTDPRSNEPEADLQVGAMYPVDAVSMGQSSTYVRIKGKSRNSVMFEFYENGAEINIFTDPRYNPYMGTH